jgi:DNA-directed RNA polymerase subunit M/transcription elongation factor TFIIS
MAGFACAACGAEFETRERLEEHKRKEHSAVQQDAGSTHTRSGQQGQQTKSQGKAGT